MHRLQSSLVPSPMPVAAAYGRMVVTSAIKVFRLLFFVDLDRHIATVYMQIHLHRGRPQPIVKRSHHCDIVAAHNHNLLVTMKFHGIQQQLASEWVSEMNGNLQTRALRSTQHHKWYAKEWARSFCPRKSYTNRDETDENVKRNKNEQRKTLQQ